MEEKQSPDECKNFSNEDGCLCEQGNSDMRNVSDWVRRSVLFWNQGDNQNDSSSIYGGSDDALFNGIDEHDMQPDNRSDKQSDNPSDKQSDCTSSEQENLFIAKPYETDKEISNVSPLKIIHDSQTEPTKIFDTDELASTDNIKDDVENIQKFLIEPFIMGDDTDKSTTFETANTDSTYYTLNFPKYSEHVYSPLYEEHVKLRTEKFYASLTEGSDWNIAERLNRLSQTRGQLTSDCYNTGIKDKEIGEITDEHGEEMDNSSVKSDISNAIKKVQDTLGEIADELETTRTRKTSKDRDPNVILVDLLSRIQPPANRDSYSYSPTEDATQTYKELADEVEGNSLTEEEEEARMSNCCHENSADVTAVNKGMLFFCSRCSNCIRL